MGRLRSGPEPGALAGLGPAVRLALRRDRVWLPVWVALIVLEVAATASAYQSLYPTLASRESMAVTIGGDSPVLAMYGPAFNLLQIGGITAWRLGAFGAVFVALMSLLTVVRHTRTEEETGRLELLRSGVVGRHTPLVAALLEVFGAVAAIAVLVALALAGQHQPLAGSLALGLGWAGTGLVFAGLAAVTAQITESSRTASGCAAALLGLAYLLRAVGDGGSAQPGSPLGVLSWLSPVGWAQQLRAFAGERWWVLALPVAVTALLVGVAFALEGRRDFGAGLVPSRLGAARGSLSTAAGLGWRLQRGGLLAWAVGLAVYGLAIGSIAHGVIDLLSGNDAVERLFQKLGGAQALVDSFLSAMLGIIAILVTVHGISAVLRLKAEESELHAEQLLATGLPRHRWAWSHLSIALLSPPLLMAVTGLSMGLSHAAAAGDPHQVWRVAGAAMVQVPAMWVLTALAFALYGTAERLGPLAWLALAACGLLGQVGPLFNLPDAVLRVSPYADIPKLPGADLSVAPLAVLVLVAAGLLVAGVTGLRRRDLG
jgi:ABC-2 type transport system permease protein